MRFRRTLRQSWGYSPRCAANFAALFLSISFAAMIFAAPCAAQSVASGGAESGFVEYLNRYPGLMPEIGVLVDKLQKQIKFPAERRESRLLPLLPASTMSYAAIPNYGDAAHQALEIFQAELQESAVLRDWLKQGDPAVYGRKVVDSLEKFYQLQQYLGEEIVVSAAMNGKEPSAVLLAEVKKPGLKKFLEQMLKELGGDSPLDVRVLDPMELGTASAVPSHVFYVLVRPDVVVAAPELDTLRQFGARLDQGRREFAATAFAQRVQQEYKGGVTVLAAADVQTLLKQKTPSTAGDATFERSGFADMKYLIWEHRSVGEETLSQAELSFNGPRHGAASWLAKSGPLSSLDFVSPKTMLALTVSLAHPAQIFDELKALLSTPGSNPFAAVEQFEQALNLSLKDDLLQYLSGELTVELDSVAPPMPVWKAILKVNDTGRLQKTLSTLLAAVHMEGQQFIEGGVTYNTIRIPAKNVPLEIGYAFADGHLIVGSSQEVVAESVTLHKSGAGLGKTQKFLAALPAGHRLEASGLLYEDPIAMVALRLRAVAPAMAESLAQASRDGAAGVFCVYGEESSIREATKGGAFDVGAALVVAAIAIPNLLRARMAANEASAVGMVRTMVVAEVTYAATYPQRNYAPDLASLGPDLRKPQALSPEHAGLINETLGNESCTANAWCTKSGYRFRLTGVCKKQSCMEYVAMATPVDANTGIRSFCATSEGLIRFHVGTPLTAPLSVAECKRWVPLQ